MNCIEPNKPLWQLTEGEFFDLLIKILSQIQTPQKVEERNMDDEYVYGLDGLAKLLGCHKQHAYSLKKDGVFDGAVMQRGKKIIVNKRKALELFGNNKKLKK
jgi:hypothetical protein